MKYGPISAASSARMKAIDNPSSVVCTGSPFEHVPALRPSRGMTRSVAQAAAPEQRHIYSAIYRANYGEVTAPSRGGLTLARSPACRQPLEAAEHKGRTPFRVLGVVEPQL